MTSAESLNLIVAIGAAIATALSAFAAFRSAWSAALAQRSLLAEQLRTERREIAALVSGCSYELSRIRFLAQALNIIDQTNATFAGGFGGSRHKIAKERVAKRLSSAEEIFKAAAVFKDNPGDIGKLVQEDIDRLHVSLTIALDDLRAIAIELDRNVSSGEAEMLQFRERAIIGADK